MNFVWYKYSRCKTQAFSLTLNQMQIAVHHSFVKVVCAIFFLSLLVSGAFFFNFLPRCLPCSSQMWVQINVYTKSFFHKYKWKESLDFFSLFKAFRCNFISIFFAWFWLDAHTLHRSFFNSSSTWAVNQLKHWWLDAHNFFFSSFVEPKMFSFPANYTWAPQ